MKRDLDLIVDNEKEWRKYILEKVDKIDQEMSTLKIRVAVISAFFGAIGSIIVAVASR